MPRYPIAAITDEFSPDIETAVRSMQQIGMTGAELRMVFGKNIIDLSDEELDRAIAIVRGAGMEIISIASPLLKCVLPDAPEVDFEGMPRPPATWVENGVPSRSPIAPARASSGCSPTGEPYSRTHASTGSWPLCVTWPARRRRSI